MNVFLVSLQSLDDASVSFQAALPQLVQVIHHVIVRLEQQQDSALQRCPRRRVRSPYSFTILMTEPERAPPAYLIHLRLGSLLQGVQYDV